MRDIVKVWNRLSALEGEEFKTKTGLPFTYTISGDVLRVSRTEYNLTKANFAKAFKAVPFDGPGNIQNDVRGPSYVWALLHDSRVRNGEW